ncbi:MAG: YraN family protein [Candidatus Nitrohelix vancouverensis]|uniref:UPF0102 protein G3M78_10305 n=1 Tax=Candidatus Nitrohelix vancouverensis TaxID=2705534 RepID=A0A7T0G3Y4_9BACT|nr:MAG: YraN family protein [Candidatus Nitrohelix vancouverensis]
MTKANKSFGDAGEAAAVARLKKLGYRILKTNYKAPFGEIDVIAEHEGAVVFVEVKARSGTDFGGPLLAVHPQKQRKIAQVAQYFLTKNKIGSRETRFDVVGITGNQDDWTIEVVKGAFRI